MRRETYENWILLCAKYFKQYYQCDIKLPKNMEDESYDDGLEFYFYNFNWHLKITNSVLHYMHDRICNRRQGMNLMKEYITMALEEAIFTPKGLMYKDKAWKHTFKMLEDKKDIEFMRPTSIRK